MKKLLIIFLTIICASFVVKINIDANTDVIIGPDLVQKEKYQVLTLSDILALYSSNLGSVSIQNDNFTGNGAVIGVYEIELIASDGTNQVVKTIEVQVLDRIGSSVRAVTDQVNIHIAKSNLLTAVNIINVHAATGVVTTNTTSQYEVITDNYTENSEIAGTYLFEYRLMDATGLDKTVSCTITVHDSERLENPSTVIPEKEPSQFWSKLKNTVTSIVVLGAAIFLGLYMFKFLRRK